MLLLLQLRLYDLWFSVNLMLELFILLLTIENCFVHKYCYQYNITKKNGIKKLCMSVKFSWKVSKSFPINKIENTFFFFKLKFLIKWIFAWIMKYVNRSFNYFVLLLEIFAHLVYPFNKVNQTLNLILFLYFMVIKAESFSIVYHKNLFKIQSNF